MAKLIQKKKANFGTGPVFFTAISTILGAIMFLRFGYAVGNVGFWGTIGIILIGHLVTIPTAMSLAEIATNQKVEGGGEYYIISRSFGLNIGAAIGITLYLSQAISVAFYVVAFGEAFEPVKDFLLSEYGWEINNRFFTIPAMLLLTALMLTKGADIGMKALYVVVFILFTSLVLFFLGNNDYSNSFDISQLNYHVSDPDDFFYVFAICFPAFTGMTAGVGLSGDLQDPKKSIPLGTLSATIAGMVIYVFIAYKLISSASPEDLDSNQLIMSQIALWGPIIPIGLAAATISSALGSFMVAPRTLQALGNDKIFPSGQLNKFISLNKAQSSEPFNAGIVTSIIAIIFVSIGDVNFVAEIISMFFMVTYGSLCLISFFQHFSANPAYRPSFKSRWYISFIGGALCFYLMFKMNTLYAILSLVIMWGIYILITYKTNNKEGLAQIFQGVIFQFSRRLQVFLQKTEKDQADDNWRPSVICMSSDSFKRFQAFELMKWISQKYGFGTYIHHIDGYYSSDSQEVSKESLTRLIRMANISGSNLYLDTLISPSYTAAVSQLLQFPSISGTENNMAMFEFSKNDYEGLDDITDNYKLLKTGQFDVCLLASSQKGFGLKNAIHIWITSRDFDNANLMILLSYMILGHPDWKSGHIKIYAVFPEEELATQRKHILEMIKSGRLPISANNVSLISFNPDLGMKKLIAQYSEDADLTMVGFNEYNIQKQEDEFFRGYEDIGNVLFVNTISKKSIK